MAKKAASPKKAPAKKVPPKPKAMAEQGPKTTLTKVGEKVKGPAKKGKSKEPEKSPARKRAEAGKTPTELSEYPAEDKKSLKKVAQEQAEQEKKKGRGEREAKYDRTYGVKFTEVLYPDINILVYRKFPKGINEDNADENGEAGVLDASVAAEILGWEEEPSDKSVSWGKHYKFKWGEKKIRLTKNPTNRPFRKSLAYRYALEILRGEWQLNGEPIILDKYGRVQSGQHRLVAVIMANSEAKEDIEKWSDYGWKDGNVFIESLVVVGIDPDPKVVDTIDLGQKRSLGDVIFRDDTFSGDERKMTQLSNALSHALRLVWLRVGGKKVSDAPHFPHSEALNFLKEHPRLKECVTYIKECEGTKKSLKEGEADEAKDSRRVSQFISLGYASGLMYLMATSKTDREAYDDGEKQLDFSNWEKAKDFWHHFATNKGLPAGNPIKELRKRLMEISGGDGAGRDEIIGTVAKAFNFWIEGKTTTAIKLRRKETDDTIEITEEPRMGGLDTAID